MVDSLKALDPNRPIREAAEERETRARVEYSCFRRAEADKLFNTLPAEEQAVIEALARVKTAPEGRGSNFMAETLFKLKRTQTTAERHSDRIISFADWRAGHAREL